MMWSGGLVDWVEGDTAYISVAFSWKLQDAYQRCVWYQSQGYKVRAGCPGTYARRSYLKDVAELGGEVDAITYHNPYATYASRGCPVGCYFCIVPKMEGKKFTLLPDFTPRPILCDNNLSALPIAYQNHIIEKYQKSGVILKDITSGFEPHSFDEDTYHRWKAIYKGYWRYAYDDTCEGDSVYRMTQILSDIHSWDRRVYVLIGNDHSKRVSEESCKS